jgi:hypothetical protein
VQVGTSCITGRQWKRVLLSSESDKIPKVVLLRQTFDQAREIKEQKALLRDKSKLKIRPSLRLSPLLRPVETRTFVGCRGANLIATICCTRRLL